MGIKEIGINKKAFHDYEILDRYEAGMSLLGTEIKSVRKGKVQLKESYVSFSNGEAYVKGMNVAQYDQGNRFNHDETRERKLLLHKSEIRRLIGQTKQQGFTLIPLSLYFKGSRVKLQMGLCRGKKLHDKRQDIAKRDAQRDIQRAMKERNR